MPSAFLWLFLCTPIPHRNTFNLFLAHFTPSTSYFLQIVDFSSRILFIQRENLCTLAVIGFWYTCAYFLLEFSSREFTDASRLQNTMTQILLVVIVVFVGVGGNGEENCLRESGNATKWANGREQGKYFECIIQKC